jgi:transglutaminase-like putative cysteine protease
MNFDIYLRPTRFIDADNPKVIAYANQVTSPAKTNIEKCIDLFYAVRDNILYDPHHIILEPEAISASLTLQRGRGYCVEKSLLLCALGRVIGVPSRMGFSIVRNHLEKRAFFC